MSLHSCEYFNVKKTSSEVILKEELQTFNWNEVDAYPTFLSCDSDLTKQESKNCFQRTLITHVAAYLQEKEIIVSQDVSDTIILEFKVNEKGGLSLLNAKIDSLTYQEIPNIKDLLIQSLDSLPKVFPALKRGQQVTTAFKLPIVVSVN